MTTTARPPADSVEALSRQDIVSILLAPFSADQISTVTKDLPDGRKTFPNVEPHHFIKNLLENLGGYVSFELAGPMQLLSAQGAHVIVQPYRIRVDHPNFKGSFEAVGAKETTGGNAAQMAFDAKSSVSDGMKLAAKHGGKGLHIYMEPNPYAEQNAAARTETYNAQPAPQAAPPPVQQQPYQQPAQTQQAPVQQQQQSSMNQLDGNGGGNDNSGGGPVNDHTPAGDPNHGSVEPTGLGQQKTVPVNQCIGSFLKWAGGEPSFYPEPNAPGGQAIQFTASGMDRISDKRLNFLRGEIARRVRNGTWDPKEGDKPRSPQTQRSNGGRSGSALPQNFY